MAAALVLAAAFPLLAPAADPPPGRAKSRPCQQCHGALGLSTMPGAPNLAGQPAMYLTEQLRAFRSGKRTNEIMNLIAKPLSDEDIGQLAAWYASVRVEAKEGP